MKVSKIKTLHLQKYINELSEEGKAYGTVNNHYFCLNSNIRVKAQALFTATALNVKKIATILSK